MIETIIFTSQTQGNVGLIFTKGDLKEVSEEVAKYKVRTIQNIRMSLLWFQSGLLTNLILGLLRGRVDNV